MSKATSKASKAPAAGSAQHTPGPWVVWAGHAEVHAGPAKSNKEWLIEGVRGHIASFTSDDWGGEDEELGEAIAQANARLGAAAPALADALEAMLLNARSHKDCPRSMPSLPTAKAEAALRLAGRLP